MTPARGAFPPGARLHQPAEFEQAFGGGRRLGEKWLTAVVVANTRARPRLGLAISRKSAAQATDRNRIKRTVRESFRVNQARLPAVDIVILARPGCGAVKSAELRPQLDRLWSRIATSCAASPSP